MLSDEIHETFDFGGDDALSFQDTDVVFDAPVGEWGGGRLSAAFAFDGTGGPNGDFDWVIRTGESFLFDTTHTAIVGGPNGVPTTTLNAVNGGGGRPPPDHRAGREAPRSGPQPDARQRDR